jgi:hypothetical protein
MMKKDQKNNSVMKNFKGCAPMSIGLSSKLSFGVSKPKVQNCVKMEV